MRILARELGYGVMSLYNHVADKDDLLMAMADEVIAQIELPEGAQDWKQDLSDCAVSAHRVILSHAWLVSLWGRSLGPAKNRYLEAILRIMRQAGFPEELACRGFHAVTMHVVGFASQVLDMPFSNKNELVALAKKNLATLDEREFPYLREHIHFHLDGRDTRSDFRFMLGLLLDGLERDFEGLQSAASAGSS